MSALTFSPGTPVEVNLGAEDSPDIWYPATVIKESGKESFLVEYRSSNETGPLKVEVDCLHIRPSPPRCVSTTFQLLEKVDAFYNFGWSSGVITKVLSEGRYIVFFKPTRKEKELSYLDLRLPMVRRNGKWASQDAAVMSNSLENMAANLVDNGKTCLPPENSEVAKESEEESRNGQEEQAVPLGKQSSDSRTVSSTRIKRVTRNVSRRGRAFKKLITETATEQLELTPQGNETKITVWEQLDQPARLELPLSEIKSNACSEQSKNGNEAHDKSASPGRKLEILQNKVDLPTNKRTSFRGRGRGQGRARKSMNRRASSAGVAAKQIPFRESSPSDITKPLIISLPCNNNGQWNLQPRSTRKLPVQTVMELQKEEKQLPVQTDSSTANTVKHGIPVEIANDVNPETKRSKDESIKPRRKRGRPFGSLSAGKINENETSEMPTAIGSTRSRTTREKRAVYESAMDTLRPRAKKMKQATETSSSSQEPQANLKGKAGDVIRNDKNENVEPVSHGVSGNISDDDRPLSTWLGEAHYPPDHTKPIPGENASQSGKVEARSDQVKLAVQHNGETTKGNNVGVAQNASQHEDDTMTTEGEIVMDPTGKSLPFSKASPIWKMIESMEVFRHIPQNPHFQPLHEIKEHSREGLAIGSMVTFSGLVEKISRFKLDDPSGLLEGSMETLSDLERHGFRVELIRNRLETLLSIKSRHDQAQTLSKEIAEQHKERARIDQEINEIDKKITELTEKRSLTVLESQKKDAEISGLQSRFESIKEAMEGARSEFERLASAPW